MAANTNPKQCDHCLAELPQTYRLEMPGYEAQGKERRKWSCNVLSAAIGKRMESKKLSSARTARNTILMRRSKSTTDIGFVKAA